MKSARIIVALDGMAPGKAFKLVGLLAGKAGFAGVKVNDLFFGHGPEVIDDIDDYHCEVMLDAKLHDIPNTVCNTVNKLKSTPGISILTVHASGGPEMLKAAVLGMPGKIAAVTVLTSLDEAMCKKVYNAHPEWVVGVLSSMAAECGCSYIVCSGHELGHVKAEGLKKIVPGIRPEWYQAKQDQKRVMTPAEAVDAGADLLVVGRAITMSEDPVAALERTGEEAERG